MGYRYAALLLALLLALLCTGCTPQEHAATTFAMDTLVTQRVYGKKAEQATAALNTALAAWEKRLSLFEDGSDISAINRAGCQGTQVSEETADLLRRTLQLSAEADGRFALSIAPLTLAWGVTSDEPRVPGKAEIAALLPLVNDGAVQVEGNTVRLLQPGMALDLGGVAKGAAAGLARDIYNEYGIQHALLSLGGNIYAHGTRADGQPWRIGFAGPSREEGAYIASFELEDAVVAVSGGYERYFEADGERYIHILDPHTGYPAESDILTVGVVCEEGLEADFWSTALFVGGKEAALQRMQNGLQVMMLCDDGVLYVSEGLQDGFEFYAEETYTLQFVPQNTEAAV